MFFVYGVLGLLLVAMIGASLLPLGVFTPFVVLGLAAVQAGLVAWFFMDLRRGSALVRLFAGAAVLWLVILFALGLNDWLSR